VAAGARIVLAITFAFSALAKLRSWRTLPDDMRAFGIPANAAAFVAIALPVAELGVAVTLVGWWSAAWPAWIALAMLLLFTVMLVRAAAAHTPCPCFGSAHDVPAGPAGVVRNGVLLAVAALATADPSGAHRSAVFATTAVLGAAVAVTVVVSGRAPARRD
jgi:hypothetical protein